MSVFIDEIKSTLCCYLIHIILFFITSGRWQCDYKLDFTAITGFTTGGFIRMVSYVGNLPIHALW